MPVPRQVDAAPGSADDAAGSRAAATPWPALLALAVAAFATGSAEFVAIGLLPDLAGGFGVPIGVAGLVVSVYAIGVVVGGPVLTAAGTRVPRRTMLLGLMGLFVAGNVVVAVAPVFPVVLAGRVLAALGQGAFFGIGSVVAADLVDEDRRSRAIALVFCGVTAANVLGAPLGTLLGQQTDWRAAFGAVAGAGAIGLLAIAVRVPSRPHPRVSLRHELAAFGSGAVWLTLLVGGLAMCGTFTMFSYAAPLFTEVAGVSPGALTPILVLFGLGLTLGNALGGRWADRSRLAVMVGASTLLAAALAVLGLVAQRPVPAAVAFALVGCAGFAVIPAFLGRLIDLAASAPTLAAAAAGSAANLGIALGAAGGGLALDSGWGFTAPVWLGAALAAAAAAVAAVAVATTRITRTGS